jgi:hypothetical protein
MVKSVAVEEGGEVAAEGKDWLERGADKEEIEEFKRSIQARPTSSLKFRNNESRACLIQ